MQARTHSSTVIVNPAEADVKIVNNLRALPGPTGVAVSFEVLERLEADLAEAYESASGVCDAGLADWSYLGAPVAKALQLVRTILSETAA